MVASMQASQLMLYFERRYRHALFQNKQGLRHLRLAEQVSVQDLLAAIAEVQELIRNAEQEAAETVDNNGDIPGQIAMVGFFHPLTFHSRICTIYGG